MKVAVVGGGGREHAIIKKLRENPRITQLYALPGNGGIGCDAACVPVKATDLDGIEEFVRTHGIEFVVVAPDDPLVMGLVDRLNGIGVPCFGPDAKAAIIEGSKAFSKQLMKKYNIPTARYEIFTDAEQALDIRAEFSGRSVEKRRRGRVSRGVDPDIETPSRLCRDCFTEPISPEIHLSHSRSGSDFAIALSTPLIKPEAFSSSYLFASSTASLSATRLGASATFIIS